MDLLSPAGQNQKEIKENRVDSQQWLMGAAVCMEGNGRGPKTKRGLEKAREANWKHGYYSGKAILERKQALEMMKILKK